MNRVLKLEVEVVMPPGYSPDDMAPAVEMLAREALRELANKGHVRSHSANGRSWRWVYSESANDDV